MDTTLIERRQIFHSYEIQNQAKLLCVDEAPDISYLFVYFCVRSHEGAFLGSRNILCLDQGCGNMEGIIYLHV